jgi:hypothetical protein
MILTVKVTPCVLDAMNRKALVDGGMGVRVAVEGCCAGSASPEILMLPRLKLDSAVVEHSHWISPNLLPRTLHERRVTHPTCCWQVLSSNWNKIILQLVNLKRSTPIFHRMRKMDLAAYARKSSLKKETIFLHLPLIMSLGEKWIVHIIRGIPRKFEKTLATLIYTIIKHVEVTLYFFQS